jgi:hypothetical protein
LPNVDGRLFSTDSFGYSAGATVFIENPPKTLTLLILIGVSGTLGG